MLEIAKQTGLDKDSTNKSSKGYRDARNVFVGVPLNGNVESVKRQAGNTQIPLLNKPAVDGLVVGSYEDKERDTFYYFVKSYGGDDNYIAKWDGTSANAEVVVESSFLDFSGARLNGIRRVGESLYWNDPESKPAQLMLDQVANFGDKSTHIEEYFSDAKRPPLMPIQAFGCFFETEKGENTSEIQKEVESDNYTGLYFFSYKFIYKDNSESLWAPHTKFNLETRRNTDFSVFPSSLPEDGLYYLGKEGNYDRLMQYEESWTDGNSKTKFGLKPKFITLSLGAKVKVYNATSLQPEGTSSFTQVYESTEEVDGVLQNILKFQNIIKSVRVAYRIRPTDPYRLIKDVSVAEIVDSVEDDETFFLRFTQQQKNDFVALEETNITNNRMPISAKAMTFAKNAKIFGNVQDEFEDFTKTQLEQRWIDFGVTSGLQNTDRYERRYEIDSISALGDTITLTEDPPPKGTLLKYDANGNTPITGMTDGQFYYNISGGSNISLGLHRSAEQAVDAVDISGSVSGTQYIIAYKQFNGSTDLLKNDSKYKFGIVFHDNYGRIFPVLTYDDKEVNIAKDTKGNTYPNVTVDTSITPSSRIPSNFTHFSIVRTRNLTAERFWQGRVNDVFYVRVIEADGTVTEPTIASAGDISGATDSTTARTKHSFVGADSRTDFQINETDTSRLSSPTNGLLDRTEDLGLFGEVKEIHVDVSNFGQYGNNRPYVFQEGDYIKFYTRGVNDYLNTSDVDLDEPITLKIRESLNGGLTLICDTYKISSVNEVLSTYAYAEIIRPAPADRSDLFYEIGETYPISRWGESFTINEGDTYKEILAPFYTEWLSTLTSQSSGQSSEVAYTGFFNSMSPVQQRGGETWIQDVGRSYPEFKEDLRPRKENRLLFTAKYIQETNINGLSEVIGIKDVPEELGGVEILANTSNSLTSGNVVLTIGQEDSGSIYVEESLIKNPSGSQQLVAQDDFLSNLNNFSKKAGCQDYRSFALYSGNAYWVDAKEGRVVRYGQDGINFISEIGMRQYFQDTLLDYQNRFVEGDILAGAFEGGLIGGFDPFNNLYFLTIRISENDTETVIYNESTNAWMSFSDINAFWYGMLNNKFLSFDGDLNLYLNNESSKDSEFHGRGSEESFIEFIMNEEPDQDKILRSMEQDTLSNQPWDVEITNDRGQYTELSGRKNIDSSTTDFEPLHQGNVGLQFRSGVYKDYNTPNPDETDTDFVPALDGDNMVADVFYVKCKSSSDGAGLRNVKLGWDVVPTGRKV